MSLGHDTFVRVVGGIASDFFMTHGKAAIADELPKQQLFMIR